MAAIGKVRSRTFMASCLLTLSAHAREGYSSRFESVSHLLLHGHEEYNILVGLNKAIF